eukprot:gene20239-26990_t
MIKDAAAARGATHVADGSMQLVLDVLQSIADDKMPTASAAVTQDDLSEDQFRGLVKKLNTAQTLRKMLTAVSTPTAAPSPLLLHPPHSEEVDPEEADAYK